MREMSGGCLCGQVRYSAHADPAMVAVCHCKHCQKQAGTAFAIVMGIRNRRYQSRGDLRPFMTPAIVVNGLTAISVLSVDRQLPPISRYCPN